MMVQPILMCDFVFVFVTTYRSTVNMELEQHMPVRKVGQNLLPQYGGTRLGLASKVPFTLVRYFFFCHFCALSPFTVQSRVGVGLGKPGLKGSGINDAG